MVLANRLKLKRGKSGQSGPGNPGQQGRFGLLRVATHGVGTQKYKTVYNCLAASNTIIANSSKDGDAKLPV